MAKSGNAFEEQTEMNEKRHTLTTQQQLKVMLRYARCPACGEKFGALSDVQFDHIGQLAITGDNSLENFRPLHIDCHKVKTARDARDRAHVKRLMAKNTAVDDEMSRPLAKMQSRGFQKALRKKMNGKVERRS